MRKVFLSLAVGVLSCLLVRAETDKKALDILWDIQKGVNNKNQIEDLRVLDDVTIGDDVSVGGSLSSTGVLTVVDTTVSTSKDTGALIVEGGVGVEEDVYAGGQIDSVGAITAGGLLTAETNAVVAAATVSSSKDTGALILQNGGLGVEEDVYAGGQIDSVGAITAGGLLTAETNAAVAAATVSGSKDTGALVVENGGLGVEEDVYVGLNVNIGGTLDATGQSTLYLTTVNSNLAIMGAGGYVLVTNLPISEAGLAPGRLYRSPIDVAGLTNVICIK